MEKISILLVDDHPIVRQGVKQLLELEKGIEVIAEGSNGIEALQLIERYPSSILLMDVNMPKMNGMEALKEAKRLNPHQKVILLTIHDEAEYLFQAVDLGVDGYIVKDAEADDLIKAVKAVYDGDGYIHPTLTNYLIHRFNRSKQLKYRKPDNEWGLTTRELEVLSLIVEGKLNKEIGDTLVISEKTVKNHVSNIFKKMKVYDRTQAAVMAIKSGILK